MQLYWTIYFFIIRFTSFLTIYLQPNAIYTQRRLSRFRCGCHGLQAAFGKGAKHCSREDRVCLVCMPSSLKTSITFCLTAPDTVTYVSSVATLRLFRQAPFSIAALLAIDQSNMLARQSPQKLSCTKTICVGQSIGGLASELWNDTLE